MIKVTSVMESLVLVAPEIIMASAVLLLLLIGVIRKGNAEPSITNLSIYTLLALILLIFMTSLSSPMDGKFLIFSESLEVSHSTQLMKALICFSAFIVLVMGRYYHKIENIVSYEYPILALISVLGMMIMVSSANFLVVFMGIELSALSLYVMVGIRRYNALSAEAALKYFILGAISSAVLLFGISYVYGVTGSINFYEVKDFIKSFDQNNLLLLRVAFVFILVAFGFKLSLVPFHFWAPDVYQGSATQVTAFLAAAPKVAAFALLIRIVSIPFDVFAYMTDQIVAVVASLTMFFGALFALRQTNIKRLIALSSVSHMGYASLGLLGMNSSAVGIVNVNAVNSIYVYLFLYVITTTALLGCIISLRKNGEGVESIDDLKGIGKFMPKTAAAFSILLFSLAGIPPLAGFFAKLLVFSNAIKAGFYYVAIVGVVSSVIASYYYLNIIRKIYFDKSVIVTDDASTTGFSFDLTFSKSNIMIISFGIVTSIVVFVIPMLILRFIGN